jgi:hypothetical protein
VIRGSRDGPLGPLGPEGPARYEGLYKLDSLLGGIELRAQLK